MHTVENPGIGCCSDICQKSWGARFFSHIAKGSTILFSNLSWKVIPKISVFYPAGISFSFDWKNCFQIKQRRFSSKENCFSRKLHQTPN